MLEYIERDEAIRTALKVCSPLTQFDAVDIAEAMENIPTADVVEVRHGEWIRPTHFLGRIKIKSPFYFCSNCTQDVRPKKRTKYCPNCGAKMDGKGGCDE